ncbi:MAG TPA: AraC family transcriptional regulator [Rhodocyclaceae bacterium]|nr:AraC family transcriptional regulator [Rhodocyclaceae bacterium]
MNSQRFWRSTDMPFIEARDVGDGRAVCYERHSHETFSIGAITGGCSTYVNGALSEQVEEGTVVIMNPGEVHACNPCDGQPWSYLMLYVDAQWLAGLQDECGVGPGFRPLPLALSRDPSLYAGLCALYATLVDTDTDLLYKESAVTAFFGGLVAQSGAATTPPASENPRLTRAAEYISAHCTQALRLDDICKAAGLSPSYLIRAFKARYAMTPHECLINSRIQFGRAELRRGMPIASVAAAAGFADQAHFNRAFKRLVAATPGQYRCPSQQTPERAADAHAEDDPRSKP